MKSRFTYIILSIMLVILVSPYIRPTGKTGHIFTTLLAALIPLTSVYALTKDRNRAIIILFLAAPFVILDGMSMFFANRYFMIVGRYMSMEEKQDSKS
jgi:hypothetical protein